MADETQNESHQPQDPPVNEETTKLKELSHKELKEKLVTEFEFAGADFLTTKDQVITVLLDLRKRKEKEDANLKAINDAEGNEVQKTIMGKDKDGKPTELVVNPTAPTAADKAEERTEKKKWEGKALAMKARLAGQSRVQFMIPLGFGEKRGAYETVIMNGYRLNIMKGVLVQLPQQVAELLAESYQMTAAAGQEFLIDRDDAIKDTLK